MTESMEAEFDTVAEWTARVAVTLGPDFYVPAGCRGSGHPAALDWLLDRMHLVAGGTLLDCGAGVGGPAAYAARARNVRPLLVDPEPGACRAARRLFGYPTVRADAAALPIADATVDTAWSLGVLCTTPDQVDMLAELSRVVRPGGRIGLLTFVAHCDITDDDLEDNHFPSASGLLDLLAEAELAVEEWQHGNALDDVPASWSDHIDTVEDALKDRYGDTQAWQQAQRQSSAIAGLLDAKALTAELLILRSASL